MTTDPAHHDLTGQQVRRVARLARLALSDEQVDNARAQLGAVLRYVESLGELDLTGVEPMAHPTDAANRWDDDEPRPGLPNQALMDMAPQREPPYIRVPKVIGGGEGA
jgi:aspartyl-tRNA(Asn)/glutamyl-tRNA(Gln) amidotransferase subunit C